MLFGKKKIEGKTAEEWYQEGEAYADSEKYEDAIRCYDKALEVNPKDAVTWKDKAVICGCTATKSL